MNKYRKDKQYELGQYMTPEPLADRFFEYITVPPPAWRVLDPSCGDGNLLLAALRKLQAAGIPDPHKLLCGVDIDPSMVARTKERISAATGVPESELLIFDGDYLGDDASLFADNGWRNFDPTIVISNPPYGSNREYLFFEKADSVTKIGTQLVFLVPLSFMDRVSGAKIAPIDGRPFGVTTGHCFVAFTKGDKWTVSQIHGHRSNSSSFQVLTGVKLYERGAGTPPQDEFIVKSKPFSSSTPRKGWLPCARTGDVQPGRVTLDRLWVKWGDHLAHSKEIERFTGPRLFVRRVPIWANRQLGSAFIEKLALCAGDILVVRHVDDDRDLLLGLCEWLNSPEAADAVLTRRPSVKHRMSFPKISAKDLHALLDNEIPSAKTLRELSMSHPSQTI